MQRLTFISFYLLVTASLSWAQSQTASAAPLPADKNKFALIISGISGEEGYAKKFNDWTAKLRTALTKQLGFADEQVIVLAEKPAEKEQRAAAETVRQVFVQLRNALKPEQQLFVFFIGHGSFDANAKQGKFNLVGPDLTADDYAQLLKALPTQRQVIVNMASASGEFIKPLSAPGRVVITATRSGMEQNATRFAEPFINGLAATGNKEADADKSGRVSVLEAFEYAAKLVLKSFESKGTLVTEHALIDDDGDGTGHPAADAAEGSLAKTIYFDSLPLQHAGGDAVLAKLYEDKLRLEGEIERVKARKKTMDEDAFYAELEKPLLELAKISQTIRARRHD
jgi:hypothetical protein